MKVIKQELYKGCYEQRVYPFADTDSDPRTIGSDGYVKALFVEGETPRIIGNFSLGEMTIEDVEKLQEALAEVVWLVEQANYFASKSREQG